MEGAGFSCRGAIVAAPATRCACTRELPGAAKPLPLSRLVPASGGTEIVESGGGRDDMPARLGELKAVAERKGSGG